MTIHRAKRTAIVVNPNGGRRITVRENGPYNDAEKNVKALVRAYPDLFETDSDVEQATNAPGEKRSTTRTRARKSLQADKKSSKK